MKKPLVMIAALLLAGCAAIEPNAIRVYTGHVSSISQHFGPDPTHFGYNTVMVEAHYQRGGAFLDIADGVNITARDLKVRWQEYGSLDGPREVFTARLGWEFKLK